MKNSIIISLIAIISFFGMVSIVSANDCHVGQYNRHNGTEFVRIVVLYCADADSGYSETILGVFKRDIWQ